MEILHLVLQTWDNQNLQLLKERMIFWMFGMELVESAYEGISTSSCHSFDCLESVAGTTTVSLPYIRHVQAVSLQDYPA
jgi:hypothetical protein